jgi:hypothetical protein
MNGRTQRKKGMYRLDNLQYSKQSIFGSAFYEICYSWNMYFLENSYFNIACLK